MWHHGSEAPTQAGGRGPKQLTGMVDLTPEESGGRGLGCWTWCPAARAGPTATGSTSGARTSATGVQVATLDPFHGYKNAIDDQLQDAVAVLDAFHVVKLGTQAVDEVRRRVQQQIHGHRGRKNDPLYGIRAILRCGAEKLDHAITADERHDEVYIAWQCAQQLRSAYKAPTPVAGRGSPDHRIAASVIASLPTCPIPEIKRLGRTLKQWREAFLAYFDTHRANNAWHRSRERPHRTPPPHRPRLPQPRPPPTTHAPHRRRTHPPPPQLGRAGFAVRRRASVTARREGRVAASARQTA